MNDTKPRDTTADATIAVLAETFPKCFSIYERRRQPLKLGIHVDIQAALDGAVTPAELSKGLRYYCSNRSYLANTREGVPRLDLDGKPAGSVSLEEEANAKAALAGIRAKKEARTAIPKAAAKPANPEPPKRLSLADLKAAALVRKQGAGQRQ